MLKKKEDGEEEEEEEEEKGKDHVAKRATLPFSLLYLVSTLPFFTYNTLEILSYTNDR